MTSTVLTGRWAWHGQRQRLFAVNLCEPRLAFSHFLLFLVSRKNLREPLAVVAVLWMCPSPPSLSIVAYYIINNSSSTFHIELNWNKTKEGEEGGEEGSGIWNCLAHHLIIKFLHLFSKSSRISRKGEERRERGLNSNACVKVNDIIISKLTLACQWHCPALPCPALPLLNCFVLRERKWRKRRRNRTNPRTYSNSRHCTDGRAHSIPLSVYNKRASKERETRQDS